MPGLKHPVTADNEMPDDDPADFDDAYADIERWLASYSESADTYDSD